MSSTGKRLLWLIVILSAASMVLLRDGGDWALLAAAGESQPKTVMAGAPLLTAEQNPPVRETTSPAPAREIHNVESQIPQQASWPRTVTMRMRITAYCPCEKCCGKFADGITASGKSIYANSSMFVAADTSVLPFGTMISIEGYHGGLPVPVLDRGKAIKNNRIDVFFPSHEKAKKWGSRWIDVTVYLPEE